MLPAAFAEPTLCQHRKGWGTPFRLWDILPGEEGWATRPCALVQDDIGERERKVLRLGPAPPFRMTSQVKASARSFGSGMRPRSG
jgi:hypothetical protein